jgi:DNA-binding SARP family transcriptional activator
MFSKDPGCACCPSPDQSEIKVVRLAISLLGAFRVSVDESPVTAFGTDKARALLAYLVAEADRPHRREALAGLLWPDRPDATARNSLRQALHNMRHVLDPLPPAERTLQDHELSAPLSPPFLLVTPGSIQFNSASEHWLDVAEFERLVAVSPLPPLGQRRDLPLTRVFDDRQSTIPDPPSYEGLRQTEAQKSKILEGLESAIALYRGDFLAGLSLPGSTDFEEWMIYRQEYYHRLALETLVRLADHYEQSGDYERAAGHLRRQLELEPWHEKAHGQLMRVLALSGQRSAALRQYEICRTILAQELRVPPAKETRDLYEQIRDGKLGRGAAEGPVHEVPMGFRERVERLSARSVASPSLRDFASPHLRISSSFVARKAELVRLDGFLQAALAGQGQVAFVTGEAGSGKTALLHEFCQRAMTAHGDLVVACGKCGTQGGVGQPYLPFIEIAQMLTGKIAAWQAVQSLTQEHERRLSAVWPDVAEAVIETSPQLIGTLVDGEALLARARALAPVAVPWYARLEAIVEQAGSRSLASGGRSAGVPPLPLSGARPSHRSACFFTWASAWLGAASSWQQPTGRMPWRRTRTARDTRWSRSSTSSSASPVKARLT